MSRVKQDTISKYEKRIAWADMQPKNMKIYETDSDRFNHRHRMLYAIEENWFSDDCPHCDEYIDKRRKEPCINCPLYTESGCCDGLWAGMVLVVTWGEWVKRARKLLKYVRKHG